MADAVSNKYLLTGINFIKMDMYPSMGISDWMSIEFWFWYDGPPQGGDKNTTSA